jgi:hypothetical protein
MEVSNVLMLNANVHQNLILHSRNPNSGFVRTLNWVRKACSFKGL